MKYNLFYQINICEYNITDSDIVEDHIWRKLNETATIVCFDVICLSSIFNHLEAYVLLQYTVHNLLMLGTTIETRVILWSIGLSNGTDNWLSGCRQCRAVVGIQRIAI